MRFLCLPGAYGSIEVSEDTQRAGPLLTYLEIQGSACAAGKGVRVRQECRVLLPARSL
jgi:hypothetical protein